MSTRSQREKSSRNAQHTAVLSELLREEANRYCADCGAKGPRWASWNIGCFLCIRCAGIHRNLGVHISRVKSVNLDSWTPEQLKSIQEWGNRRCKAYFECHLPDDFRRPQTDSYHSLAMESFIRNKYERKQYINKNGPPPKVTNTTKETPSVSKPLKEAKIERPKKERKKDDASSSISSKNAKLPAAPVVVSKETGGSLTSLAKPRPHPQKSDVINSKCEPPSADLLSLDHPVTVGQQTYSNSASKSSVQELIDFGGFQGHDAALGQVNQASAFVAQEETEKSLLKDDSKSTKDSIMALYKGTGGQQPQMFGVPGGMYVFPQQNAQPQQQQLITNSYGTMASGFQQQAVPGTIPQYAAPQQAQQVNQIQQQLQHMHMNNQIPTQKPSFVSQHTFNQQATASTWAPQRPVSFSQQPVQYAASSKTAPTTNSAYGINMYQVGGTHVPTGQTLSHSLWQ